MHKENAYVRVGKTSLDFMELEAVFVAILFNGHDRF